MTVPNHRTIEVDYDDLLRREKRNRDEYYISELDKDFSVSKDFLDKINTKAERMEKEREKGGNQYIFNAPVNGGFIGENKENEQVNISVSTPKPSSEVPKPIPKWYTSHWAKSIGKALFVAVITAITLRLLQKEAIINVDYTLEISTIAFCFAALFFISRDPKYKFYRGGMFCISLIGVVNLLPFINFTTKGSQPLENEGNFDWLFQLGIQDNWYISVGLFVVALYLFYKQK